MPRRRGLLRFLPALPFVGTVAPKVTAVEQEIPRSSFKVTDITFYSGPHAITKWIYLPEWKEPSPSSATATTRIMNVTFK